MSGGAAPEPGAGALAPPGDRPVEPRGMRENRAMAETFGVVLFVVVGIAAVVAVVTMAGARRSYDEIGRGGLSLRDGSDGEDDRSGPIGGGTGGAPPAVSAAVRDEEIRQLVQARSDRRVRRGQEPLDVPAEVARLTAPAQRAAAPADPALRAEIRDLVVARNARRERAGKEPLDVDAEVERRLAELQA